MMAEGLKALLSDEFELIGIVEDGRAMIEPKASGLAPVDVIHDRYHPQLARSPTGKGRRELKARLVGEVHYRAAARHSIGAGIRTADPTQSAQAGPVVVEVRYPARVYYARPRDGLEGVVAFEAVGFIQELCGGCDPFCAGQITLITC